MKTKLSRAASYKRTVAASLERVWENVHDWEHLPWLHRFSFSGIQLEAAGDWGWRALITGPMRNRPLRTRIELRLESDANCYHTRTLDGPFAGADTITRLSELDAWHTGVQVEFFLPGDDPERIREAGARLRTQYVRLWDEDEEMMIERQAFLDGNGRRVARAQNREARALGPVEVLRERLPMIVDVDGDPFRILELDGRLIAHSTVCPHRGGPLEKAHVDPHSLTCPWHGYRFSLVDGLNLDAHPCRLAATARVKVSAEGEATLHFPPPIGPDSQEH